MEAKLKQLRLRNEERLRKVAAAKENSRYSEEDEILKLFERKSQEIRSALENGGNFDKIYGEITALREEVNSCKHVLSMYHVQSLREKLKTLTTAYEKSQPKTAFSFAINEQILQPPDETDFKPELPQTEGKEAKVLEFGCGFRDVEGKELTMSADEFGGKDVILGHLKGCAVRLEGSPNTLRAEFLENCRVFSGPAATSVFVDDCINSVFVVGGQQLRIHSTKGCDFYISTVTPPVCEGSRGLRFAPYKWFYPGLAKDFEAVGFEMKGNFWKSVCDFDYPLSKGLSPNCSLISEGQRMQELPK